MGLGPNGEPLRNVALNLPNSQNQNNSLGGSLNKSSNAPVPVAPPPTFPSAANVLNQSQIPNLNDLAALNNVVGNLNSLNPILSTLGLGSLASNANDASNSSALDLNKMVGASSGNSALNSGTGSANYSSISGIGSGMSQTNRLDTSHSNPFNSSTFSNLSSSISGGHNSNPNSGFGSNQRDFDMPGSVRNYNSQSDDFGSKFGQNFGSSLGNGSGSNNSNAGNNRSQNISDTILIRNVSYFISKSIQFTVFKF